MCVCVFDTKRIDRERCVRAMMSSIRTGRHMAVVMTLCARLVMMSHRVLHNPCESINNTHSHTQHQKTRTRSLSSSMHAISERRVLLVHDRDVRFAWQHFDCAHASTHARASGFRRARVYLNRSIRRPFGQATAPIVVVACA